MATITWSGNGNNGDVSNTASYSSGTLPGVGDTLVMPTGISSAKHPNKGGACNAGIVTVQSGGHLLGNLGSNDAISFPNANVTIESGGYLGGTKNLAIGGTLDIQSGALDSSGNVALTVTGNVTIAANLTKCSITSLGTITNSAVVSSTLTATAIINSGTLSSDFSIAPTLTNTGTVSGTSTWGDVVNKGTWGGLCFGAFHNGDTGTTATGTISDGSTLEGTLFLSGQYSIVGALDLSACSITADGGTTWLHPSRDVITGTSMFYNVLVAGANHYYGTSVGGGVLDKIEKSSGAVVSRYIFPANQSLSSHAGMILIGSDLYVGTCFAGRLRLCKFSVATEISLATSVDDTVIREGSEVGQIEHVGNYLYFQTATRFVDQDQCRIYKVDISGEMPFMTAANLTAEQCTAGYGLTVLGDASTGSVFVTCETQPVKCAKVNAATLAFVDSISLDSSYGEGIAMANDGTNVYWLIDANNAVTGTLVKLSAALAVVKELAIADCSATWLALNSGTAYVHGSGKAVMFVSVGMSDLTQIASATNGCYEPCIDGDYLVGQAFSIEDPLHVGKMLTRFTLEALVKVPFLPADSNVVDGVKFGLSDEGEYATTAATEAAELALLNNQVAKIAKDEKITLSAGESEAGQAAAETVIIPI
jgi:hypothetical protein